MSAVMIRKSDRIELLSDAAYCDPADGTLGAIHTKLALLPELNCIMAGRGSIPVMWITAYVAELCCASFDSLVANFATLRAEAATYRGYDISSEEWARSEIGLVGWSESKDQPQCYISLSLEPAGTGRVPRPLCPCDIGVLCEGSADIAHAFADSMKDNPDAFDARTDGLAVMELLRRERVPSDGDCNASAGHCVGGYVEHATVTRHGVAVRTIHHWPDEIGRPITPVPLTTNA